MDACSNARPQPQALNLAQDDSMTAVGDCNGLHMLPASELGAYYQAHALAAGLAVAVLAVVGAASLMF